jgi:hypothetical protein
VFKHPEGVLMPLPVSDTKSQWPPENMEAIFAHMAQWSAWYSNELSKLQAAYGGGVAADSTGFFASDTGGFKPTIGQRMQRFFVGQRPLGANRNTKLPVPMGGLICQAVGDLLYADPPTFTVRIDVDHDGSGVPAKTANPTQERLNELADAGMYTMLARGAEVGAALGGHFLRVAWDKNVVPDRPFLDVVDADQALPEFRWGHLVAVTFWSVVAREGVKVWRHLERHELSPLGVGVILHGLYEGEEERLGYRVPLSDRPETMPLFVLTEGSAVAGQVDSQSPGLCVEYVPNQGPTRLWRTDVVGRHLGRSSLDGVEHLMDQLAETLSDWMRARRAAKARVWYDKSLLGNPGPGNGAIADLDQETYVGVSDPAKGPNVKMTDKMQVLQPQFDPTGYAKTAEMLAEQILTMSGFTTQTFGLGQTTSRSIESTATEVEARERLTFLTRGRFIRTQTPHVARILQKLLAVDKAIFGTPNVVAPIWVEFPDSVQESMLRLAQTTQTLFAGQSASLDERVKILHPDWNDDMWDEEVAKIKAEFAEPVTDPFSLPAEKPPSPGDVNPVPGAPKSANAIT